MKRPTFFESLPILTIVLLTTSCLPKENQNDMLGGWSSSTDNSLAQSLFDDINNVVTRESQQQENIYDFRTPDQPVFEARTNSCAEVSLDFTPNTIFPATLIIDFGTGCTGDDGRLRTGIVTSVFTGPYREAGSIITSTLQNYSIDGFQVQGTRIFTNKGTNNAGNVNYSAVIDDGKITDLSGQLFTWDSALNYEWIEGENTNWWTHGISGVTDDVYLLTGSASGNTRDNIAYTSTVNDPIRLELNCKWPVSGKFTVSPDGFADRSVDYGTGDCDRSVLLTVGVFELNVNLP